MAEESILQKSILKKNSTEKQVGDALDLGDKNTKTIKKLKRLV